MLPRVIRSGAALRLANSSKAAFSGVRFASTFFTKDHEFAKIEGKTATCGITDFAQTQLGDVVYVSLPEQGAVFKKG